MKRLHWMILRMLPGPFLGWLGTLMFLLVMQFLIKQLPNLAGKGLPVWVIVELIAYSLAYMVVLAVPMAVLLAVLMAFGRLSESKAYAVMKSSGISPLQLIWPVMVAGLLVSGGMMYFNNIVLPEANFRARNLWMDIRTKQPGFELQPGVFYEGLDGYSILVQERPAGTNVLRDVTIYDHAGPGQTVIKATRGHLEMKGGHTLLVLTLFDGEIHRVASEGDGTRYERLRFARHRMRLELEDPSFERSDPNEGYRTDRTMPTARMIEVVDSLHHEAAEARSRLRRLTRTLTSDSTDVRLPRSTGDSRPVPPIVPTAVTAEPPEPSASDSALVAGRPAVAGLSKWTRQRTYARAVESVRSIHSEAQAAARKITRTIGRADRFLVEIYKKFSIALACLIFTIIGAPLGLSIRRGGLGAVGGLALGIFLFYWVTLVQGEKLADRGLLEPWVGMWIANVVMLLAGLWLLVYISLDLRATPPLRKRLWRWVAGRGSGVAGRGKHDDQIATRNP